MHQFMEFVMRHWGLWLLLFVLLALLMKEEANASNLKEAISAQEAVNRINNQKAKVIDLRKTADFRAAHIAKAISFPSVESRKLAEKISKWKHLPIILVSEKGSALGHIVMTLKRKGFENIAVLAGGMQEWKQQDLPTTTEEKPA
jgi:rhodanese-related sulfurtransferase